MANNPNQQGILIQLGIATAKFFTDLNQALTSALGLTTNWTKQVQQQLQNAFSPQQIQAFGVEVQHLGDRLKVNQEQFAYLVENINDYANAAAFAAQGGHAWQAALVELQNTMVAYGVSLREAGQIMLANGDIEINTLNKVLLKQGEVVLSINEINAALKQGSIVYNNNAQQLEYMSNVEKQVATDTGEIGVKAKETAGALDFLEGRIKSVVVSLLIVQTIYQVVQAFKDLTAASQQLAQTQYELAANIDYANKAIGPQIGNLQSWQAEILRLSDTLKVFSKQDITEAVSKVIELTGQLGFTKDQMSQLITVAANLAERTGKSLIDTITELSNAIGGGRLQGLHDLGLYIRNTDLATESWNEGLGKNVNGLSDQQRALVALNVVLNKTNDLVATTGDYLDSTAGQMAAADARVENSTNTISKSLTGFNLLLKNIWSDFLNYVSDAIDKFILLKQFIDQFNKQEALNQQVGPPKLQDYVSNQKSLNYGTGSLEVNQAIEKAGQTGNLDEFESSIAHIYKVAGQAGDTETINGLNKLVDAVKAYVDQIQRLQQLQDQQNSGFGQRGLQIPNSVDKGGPSTGLSDNEITAVEDTTKKVEALFAQAQKDLDKASLDYINGVTKAYDDKIQANIDALKKYNDNLAKINLDFGYKAIDETTKYHRDLADLETEEGQKEADAADVRDKKIIDNKKKYYDALRLLDEQFYFDIFDAVANNDAVAVLAAERKYNLDKDKLKQNYKDQNDAANQNYQDSIEQIQKDTERRRALLQERYVQQNQDYAIQRQREIDANAKAFNDDLAANQAAYDKQTAALQSKWDDQKALIITNTNDAYTQLTTDLAKALSAHQDYFQQLLTGWQAYYTDLENLANYYKDVPGAPNYAPPTGKPPIPQTTQCPPGSTWHSDIGKCLPNEVGFDSVSVNTNTSGTTTVKQHKLTIGSDGTVSEALVNAVVKEVANTIQDIVVERGG
jgi:hypothetical protein